MDDKKALLDIESVFGNFENIKKEIEEKIKEINKRIKALSSKEAMLDEFLQRAYGTLKATSSKEFKLRSQLQNSIMRQIELQQTVSESIARNENLIQSYMKQLMDIQNNKTANYIKWKNISEENASEKELLEIMKKFEEATKIINEVPSPHEPTIALLGDKKEDMAMSVEKTLLKNTFNEGYDL